MESQKNYYQAWKSIVNIKLRHSALWNSHKNITIRINTFVITSTQRESQLKSSLIK